MKTLIVLLSVSSMVCGQQLLQDKQWSDFKIKYGKSYTATEEDGRKKATFVSNQKKIEDHNARYDRGEVTYKMALNEFADLNTTEFLSGYARSEVRPSLTNSSPGNGSSPLPKLGASPASWDWRTYGMVSPVKKQGVCGSWAYSTTGAIESCKKICVGGTMTSLSEQQLVDCSSYYGNTCYSGLMSWAMQYIIDNGGIAHSYYYPYTGPQTTCKYAAWMKGASIRSFARIPFGDELALKDAVYTTPVCVAVDASGMQFYSSGVYSNSRCSTTYLTQAMLAVGYGITSTGTPYWIVKNSWGTGWGQLGYIFILRNCYNMCGIATSASFPLFCS